MKNHEFTTPFVFGWRLALYGSPYCFRPSEGTTTRWLLRIETRTHVYNLIMVPHDRELETWRGYLRSSKRM